MPDSVQTFLDDWMIEHGLPHPTQALLDAYNAQYQENLSLREFYRRARLAGYQRQQRRVPGRTGERHIVIYPPAAKDRVHRDRGLTTDTRACTCPTCKWMVNHGFV